MKYLLFILFVSFNFLPAQQNIEYDKILKIENLKFHEKEIRVYKKYGTSTGLELFRFYEDKKENWKAEVYNTVARTNNKDEVKIWTRKSKLNSLKNFEMLWLQFLDTNIIHLPKWEAFEYKLKKINKTYQIEDGEIYSSTSRLSVLDGQSFYVQIKRGKAENQFNYYNPESYLEKYPNVDELLSFKELLDLIRTEFKVFEKD
ncbi:hypothetical protein [Chryseobacterium balustinum]|uniref:DUF4468 domain-containing protein n=1 Tax=Chryseobacterium balustinum TaxID=246 RepID=A0AAX2IK32_9FLAO|nr:hypothetical protein [Chryseobacterium balustinum]AZB30385.1 hypothetical protein EB354_14595 [Chryseobacterium balustinum]SKB46786.1 hypothetical protein SAMN05421800_10255 [Chryseobacterium balustinum]SQA89213.1 Uncharacterised protein [Chryseobacterium balustinum]